MDVSLASRAEHIRAIDRAHATLEPGDRIAFTSCPGTPRTATFTGWDGNWICSKTRSDIAVRSIFKRNGAPASFSDPPWERYDPNTGRPIGDHGTAAQAMHWALDAGDRVREVDDVEEFMRAWRNGSAWEEWPEFYEWLEPWPAARARRADGKLAAEDIPF